MLGSPPLLLDGELACCCWLPGQSASSRAYFPLCKESHYQLLWCATLKKAVLNHSCSFVNLATGVTASLRCCRAMAHQKKPLRIPKCSRRLAVAVLDPCWLLHW